MSAPIYRPDRTLAEGEHLLIEASAGTGKTYQTEGLVVRLVAERGVPIERILVITYTRAAAAELRSRVHDCLSQAHRSLRAGEKRGKHSVLDGLLALEDRAGALENLTRALRDFDRAPISTIHRFCQRTLEQQGFSAGIEPVSGVLGDPTEIRRQIVTDTLAWLYAEATEEQLTLLQAMGWTRETLADIVKDMTGAERPVVEPSAGEHDELERWVLGQTAAWETKLEEFRSWWGTPEAERCCVAYQEDAGRTEKRIDGIKSNIEFATIVENWIESGGEKASGWLKFLRLDDLENAWKDKPVTKEKFAGLELARRFTETEGVRKF